MLRHIKTNPDKKVYKNMTYEYMREYIMMPSTKGSSTIIFSLTLMILDLLQNVSILPSSWTRAEPTESLRKLFVETSVSILKIFGSVWHFYYNIFFDL